MPIDPRTGLTLVNPNMPLGLDDFARIYTGGTSPDAVASDLWMHAPTEGKSYMSDQWSRLGINEAPERYFSRPDVLAALQSVPQRIRGRGQVVNPSPPSVQQTNLGPSIPNQWPQFANEAERNIAIGTGSYDPSYASPLKMLEHQVMTADAAKDVAQRSAYERQMFPVLSGQTPEERRRALTAGDVSGLGLKLLHGGYNPTADRGKIDITNPTKDNLDREIYHNPDFQRLLSVHPEQAKALYQQFKGRALDEDINSAKAYQTDRLKFSQGLLDESRKKAFEEQIADTGRFHKEALDYSAQQSKAGGGIYDPIKDKFKVWNIADAPEGGMGLQIQKPYRQLEPASEYQDRMLRHGLPFVTGRQLPKAPQKMPELEKMATQLSTDPNVVAGWDEAEKQLGRTMSPLERIHEAARIRNAAADKALRDEGHMPGDVLKQTYKSFGNAVLGLRGDPDTGLPINPLDVNPFTMPREKLNVWGRLLRDKLETFTTPGNPIRDFHDVFFGSDVEAATKASALQNIPYDINQANWQQEFERIREQGRVR